MKQSQSAQIDEQGRIILPPGMAKECGLTPGSTLQVDCDESGLRIRPQITSLKRVYVELTNGCNLSCSTCMRNVWNVEYGSMTEDTFEQILSGVRSFSPRPEIFLGGYGEPLSHPDCLSMIKMAKSQGLKVSLITNGILLTKELARNLIDLQLDMLWVSLDGASPDSYADVRIGDALPTILENLTQFRTMQLQAFGFSSWSMRPRLGIAFVAMRRNIHDLPEVIRLGIQLGATEFSISNVLAHNQNLRDESLYERSLDQSASPLSMRWKPLVHVPRMDINSQTAEVMTKILKGNQRINLFGSELGSSGDRCPFIERGSLSVRWDGKVSPCLPLLYTHTHYLETRLRTSKEYFVGDLQDRDLHDIWMDDAFSELRKLLDYFHFSPCTLCNSCEMADSNIEDCYGNVHPTCGGCLWAQGLIRCP